MSTGNNDGGSHENRKAAAGSGFRFAFLAVIRRARRQFFGPDVRMAITPLFDRGVKPGKRGIKRGVARLRGKLWLPHGRRREPQPAWQRDRRRAQAAPRARPYR